MIEFDEKLKDEIYACWLGKAIAGGLGAPFEGVPDSPNLKPEDLLIDTSPNDDLELQLLWLILAEKYGMEVDADKLSQAWLNIIKYGMDEYGVAIWNLRRGLKPPLTGYVDNFFIDGMGAAIRSEIWACLYPGKPKAAAYFASCDACVDHWGNGVWAEIFLAAAESNAFVCESAQEALKAGLEHIPESCNASKVVKYVMEMYSEGFDLGQIRENILKQFGSHNFTDCVMNLGFIVASLLYGEGDFEKTVLAAINFGCDTDCTAATAGSFLGILYGTKIIPAKWKSVVNDKLSVSDFLLSEPIPKTIIELTDRTFALAKTMSINPDIDKTFPPYVPLSDVRYPFAPNEWLIITDGKQCVENFEGIHLDISKFTKNNSDIDLMTTITVSEDVDGQLMLCAATGITAWLDGRQILNYHGRRKPIPAFHRTEGGGSIPVFLRAGKPYSLKIRLRFCRPPLTLTAALGDMNNQYILGTKFTAQIQ